MPKILIFVPTYNERENAPLMAQQLSELRLDADILFVDDSSPDGTGEMLESLKPEIPRLVVHHRSGKLGIGSAHAKAISWAFAQSYEILVTMDCDFTHSPSDIPAMLEKAQSCDLAVGSRWARKDSLPGWNFFRRIMTRLGHFLTKSVLGITQDASGAFRAYRLDRLPPEVIQLAKSRNYAFFFESLYIISRNGFEIGEVPITLPARTYGHSKMALGDAFRSACHIFSIALQNIRRPEQFLLPSRHLRIDSGLQDPQDWDSYWNHSGETGNPVYEIIAGIYRRAVIKRNLESAVHRHFKEGSSLLHAGCGSGQVDVVLQRVMELTAVDISTGALALYARNNHHAAAIQHGTIFQLPFAEATFDGVYNLGVMEHFTSEEIQAILTEFHRVLKPGGKVLLFWPHAKATSVLVLRICHVFMKSALKSDKQLHPPEISHMHSRQHAEGILSNAGFKLVDYSFGMQDFFVQAIVVGMK
ncbi:MAG: glycosyltransferase [Verrucomicrobiaceae bacterium]|nr:glycosyltransferase [Verrucomicrobiaceae bacterium]